MSVQGVLETERLCGCPECLFHNLSGVENQLWTFARAPLPLAFVVTSVDLCGFVSALPLSKTNLVCAY